MSTKPNDGGPAYPLAAEFDEEGKITTEAQKGKSLRAWLAGQAMSGNDCGASALDSSAQWCVEFADAVIAELDKEKETDDETVDDLCPEPDNVCGLCKRLEDCAAKLVKSHIEEGKARRAAAGKSHGCPHSG